MERYAVTIDKNSLIKNDPNDWGKEHNKPRYILDLILSVINVSVKTVQKVNSLPKLVFDGDSVIVEKNVNKEVDNNSTETVEHVSYRCEENEFVNDGDEAPTAENTLYLPIKQEYFDQIVARTKTIEYREVKSTTAKRYLQYQGKKPMLNPSCTDPSLEFELDDFNGGKFPFLPKQYKYLFLAVGYNTKRDTAIVKVEKIEFAPVEVRAKMFCCWIEEFHISKVIEVQRKENQ